MNMAQAQQLFIGEAHELLDAMESCLLEVESDEATIVVHIDAIFRAAHTIKGSAGLFGFDDIVAFTHNVESVLDKVRAGEISFDSSLASLMLDCHAHIASLINALSESTAKVDRAVGSTLLQQLMEYLSVEPDGHTALAEPTDEDSGWSTEAWHINVGYAEDVFRDGMDPSSQLSYLSQLGQLENVSLQCHFPEQEFDPESCYLSLSFALLTDATKQHIEDAFEFIQENSELSIQAPLSLLAKVDQLPPQEERLGQMLLGAGAVTQRELTKALAAQRTELQQEMEPLAVGEMLIKQGAVDGRTVDALLDKQTNSDINMKRPQPELQFFKVEAKRLDMLINLIGELVTAGAANELLLQQLANDKINETYSVTSHLIEQIRDGALSLRMVQIGDSFSRLKRVVRDASKELNKDIQLDIRGAETELDKSMVEKLSDPLMHIVRNAMDHGIEAKEMRQYKGKPAQGRLTLSAYHEAGAVVIEIQDDGAGLNADRILQKAQEKGLVQPGQALAKEDIYKLIFEAGFSTAAAVTNLSGRGVGMDVVKRNLEDLRGQVVIESEPDVGTTFRIRLPLTLAIIDGFEVSVGDTHLVLPLNMVQECIEFQDVKLTEQRNYLNLRDEVLPFIRMREIFQISGEVAERENIIVVQFGKNRAGLVVDALHGELQAVIKPLHAIFKAARGISGSTILGSGDVGFILDIPQLIELASVTESKSCSY